MRAYLRISLLFSLGCLGYLSAQSLTLVSGNGQVVQEQFLSNAPMVVEAKDASGHPAAGVAVAWKITQGSGTLSGPILKTDANGLASTSFVGTAVPGGQSFFPSTVTATSVSGTVKFIITTALGAQHGNFDPPPHVELVNPPQNNLNLTAPSGSTLVAGVVVRVVAQAGPQAGVPVPNVGVRIQDNQNPGNPPPAACNGPGGLVLTDANGRANCDLSVTAPPGTYQLTAVVGEYQGTTPFLLHVTPGVACGFALSSSSQTFPANGGTGTVNVITTTGCGWTAASDASFITITSGANGTGNGTVDFSVSTNTGAARNGTLSIAGKTYTVTQNAGTPGTLAINTSPNLAPGNVGSIYSVTLSATGGTPPYTWSLTGSLPTGLTLNASQGKISGTPSAAGTFAFTLTVKDSAGASQAQNFSIIINPASTSGFSITNTSFPAGVVGQPYQQLLTSSGGCVTPFSPSPGFRVSGGALPTGLSIQSNSDFTRTITGTPVASGAFNFNLTASDACGGSATASFTITITGSGGTQMTVNPPSISFTVQTGALNIPADQIVTITSTTSTVLNYSATVTIQSGGNWLAIKSAPSGSTPGSITVGLVNFTNLAPGNYTGQINVNSQASNSPVVVQANLTVLAALNLTVNPRAFSVTQIGSAGATITRQTIVVSSTPQVNFTATATTQSGGLWLAVDPSTAQGFTPSQVTAVINAAGLGVGRYVGTISITPAGGIPQTVTITLDVLAPAVIVATPAPLTFTYQQGAPAPSSQILSLGSTGAVLNLTIGVGTQSGGFWLAVTPVTATTPANVSVSVNPAGLAPGSYQGSLNLAASDPSVALLTVPVTLNVMQRVPSIGSITNAASFAPGPVAPGEFITIFGTSLGPATPAFLQLTPQGTVDTTLGGTQVFFDNIAAPMIFSSAGQVSAIVPYAASRKFNTELKVEFQGTASTAQLVRVIDSSPGVFMADASGQGAILNEDGSPNSTNNGALPNSIVSIYATGEGQTDPPGEDGVLNAKVLPLPKPLQQVTVKINNEPAEVVYYGAAPGQVAGMLQVNARVPKDTPRGKPVSVTVTVGAATSQAGVTLAIRP